MKLYAPKYYKRFKCIADKCEHSCCIGWEIDVDADTLKQYKKVKGDFGKRLLENIDLKCDAPHFILGEKERCPFLNERGLCDIIIELGEDSLCDICSDHPRFRNFFSDREELGLGLCCEEACRLILSKEEPTEFISEDDGEDFELFEDEEILLSVRNELFDLSAVGHVGDSNFTEITFPFGALFVKDVGFVSMTTDRLTGLAQLETLLRTAVRLNLRHSFVLLNWFV